MCVPVRPGRPGPERILETAVEPLHEAVGLRMVGGRLSVFDGEEAAQAGPQRRGELGTSVACDNIRNAETLNPPMEEGRCAVGGGGGNQRNRFRPASRSVHNSEQIRKT